MTTAFVIGNGLSRQEILLKDLQNLGKIYGCNKLYLDITPYCLIATDRPIATHIQQSGYALKHRFHTRRPLANLGALPLNKEYHAYSSGPNALGMAALDGNQTIYLVGFDMGPDKNNKFNNVYADTEFYKKAGSHPTYTGNWIRQMVKIFSDFPTTNFVRVKGATTADIPEFAKIKNIKHMPIADFLILINNLKGSLNV